jgi:hypothetical protein
VISSALYVTGEKGRWNYNGKFVSSMHTSCCLAIDAVCRALAERLFTLYMEVWTCIGRVTSNAIRQTVGTLA